MHAMCLTNWLREFMNAYRPFMPQMCMLRELVYRIASLDGVACRRMQEGLVKVLVTILKL